MIKIPTQYIDPLDRRRAVPILCLCGESGVGKSAIAAASGLSEVISYTTRAQRPGEINGKHYHFVAPEYFDEHAADFQIEGVQLYSGARYGARDSDILDKDLIVITLDGAINLRNAGVSCLIIQIAGPLRAVRAQRCEPVYSWKQHAEIDAVLENTGTIQEAADELLWLRDNLPVA
jgi:guanylate kinase